MLIHVRGAKGRKDRDTLLSESALKILREYLNRYKTPFWLFPGPDKERHIVESTGKDHENAWGQVLSFDISHSLAANSGFKA